MSSDPWSSSNGVNVANRQSPPSGGVRFAPSPTGRFHLGNLRTAWISWQWAKHLRLPWVVRVEDIDNPRVVSGAQEQQLEDLKALGMIPDLVLVQSQFESRHRQLFLEAVRSGQVYACDCSRKDVQAALSGIASAPHEGTAPIYSGRCRHMSERTLQAQDSIAWRFKMPDASGKDDFIVARSSRELDSCGIPNMATWVPGYHWACAIDDSDGQYDLLVRSIDLKPAAPLQRAIQTWISAYENKPLRQPALFHTALVVQNDGHRLEKRTKGVTLDELAARGLDTTQILDLFEAHFDRSLLNVEVRDGALLQELQEPDSRLTLADLGL